MSTVEAIRWPLLATPNVRVAGLFPLEARNFNCVYRSRFHALHLHEYSGWIRVGDQVHKLEPGTLTFSPAGTDSSYDLVRPGMHWCVHFDPQPITRRTPTVEIPFVNELGVLQGHATNYFLQITRLYTLRPSSGPTRNTLALAAAIELQALLVWAGLIDQLTTVGKSQPANGSVDKLFDYIDRNISRSIRSIDLATCAGLTPNYLARIFRQRVGMTLPRYVLTRRINLARLLLETTDLPVKQVAARVGMPDPHHFNKQFRAQAGTQPACVSKGNRRQQSPAIKPRNKRYETYSEN